VSLAQRMAIENPNITTVTIEATEFPELVRRYRVNGVPKTVVDDRVEILGGCLNPISCAGAGRADGEGAAETAG